MPQAATQPQSSLRTPPGIIALIVAISAIASLFLAWLVYVHTPTDATHKNLSFLPGVNAILNSLCTIALLLGFYFIRHRQIVKHRNSMFAAFIFSSAFLVSYITNHALHGDTLFNRLSPWWPFYWKLLASHILLSVIALPMILITFFLSLTGRFPAHKRLARYTFPIWLYVSVTGVIVYLMQAAIR
jgi:putative membrane protein